ncbi:MAG: Vitamin K epoxide reductase [Acidimicrobiaceae bacterium]|nr:Vitamin K epoxide reductase [Acidimicrobiaceae bacterium]
MRPRTDHRCPDRSDAPGSAYHPPHGGTPASLSRRVSTVYLVAGGIGLVAAFVLLLERIELLKDPNYVPSCSINPILSCGSVMQTSQAEAFGFPNPIIGIVGFTIVVTVGATLAAGAELARWFWWSLWAGTAAAVAFIHWLIFESLYRIGALCPYCMVVWVVTIPLFWYTTLHVVRHHAFGEGTARLVRHASDYHTVVLTVWYLSLAALIAKRFWDYWITVLP